MLNSFIVINPELERQQVIIWVKTDGVSVSRHEDQRENGHIRQGFVLSENLIF